MSHLIPLLRPKSFPTRSTIAASTALNFQLRCRGDVRRGEKCAERQYGGDSTCAWRGSGGRKGDSGVEESFIRSLGGAGSSRRCTQPLPSVTAVNGLNDGRHQRRPVLGRPQGLCRSISTTSHRNQSLAVAAPPEPEDNVSHEEYKELVHTYDSPSDLWEEPSYIKTPSTTELDKAAPKREHFPLAPRLVLTAEQEERPPHSRRIVLPPEDESHAAQIQELDQLVWRSQPGEQTSRIYETYMRLPRPRLRYVSDITVHKIFQHLAWVEVRDRESSMRYFSFLDDAKAAECRISTEEWNTAIAFAGRWARYTTSEEVKKAVETWMRMENEGEAPSDVTFNILADVAARAGRFALANIVVQELHARGLPLTRYYHTSQIFYAGIRRNGEAVRQAFRTLVNAGEIVDTAVMNCVILGLVRAGEAASAENVFQKMKSLHAVKQERVVRRNWRERKKLGYELRATALKLREEKDAHESSFFGSQYSNEDHKEAAQRKAPIHPDFRTCRILVRYHAEVSGNLERVREMMDEMKSEACGGRVHGSAYLSLFMGFGKWGGHAYTAWNRTSLEQYWKDFLREIEEGKSKQPSRTLASHLHDPTIILTAYTEAPIYLPFHDLPDKLSRRTSPSAPDTSPDDDEPSEISSLPPEPSREDAPTHFSVRIAAKVILAFYKCVGARRVREVWSEIQEHWPEMRDWERERVQRVVDRVVRDDYAGPRE